MWVLEGQRLPQKVEGASEGRDGSGLQAARGCGEALVWGGVLVGSELSRGRGSVVVGRLWRRKVARYG